MILNKKIIVVLPAYNASKTLIDTYKEIPFDIIDDVILVDDNSTDETIKVANEIGIKHIIEHQINLGYGGNQKSCYKKAIELGGDIIIMLHPDYQYTPKLIHSMSYLIANEVYPVVLGSRILGKGALSGGMPIYKYIANRFLTLCQNILMNQKLSINVIMRYFDKIDLRSYKIDNKYFNELVTKLDIMVYKLEKQLNLLNIQIKQLDRHVEPALR